MSELTSFSNFILPKVLENTDPVWHLFVIQNKDRDFLKEYLLSNQIHTMVHYPIPPHKQNAYKELKNISLPISEEIHSQVLSLPMGPHLSIDEVNYIIEKIKCF